ncbi:MAG: hypothetical protein P4L84_36970 [Isosphaeraceae bacterium]|nr:hypothetical protein [Isosphaeraceae bacterium]
MAIVNPDAERPAKRSYGERRNDELTEIGGGWVGSCGSSLGAEGVALAGSIPAIRSMAVARKSL